MTDQPWLTHVPDREPRRKAHEHYRDAKKAVHGKVVRGVLDQPVHVYRWSDSIGWELVWKLLAGTPVEDLPWNREAEKYTPSGL